MGVAVNYETWSASEGQQLEHEAVTLQWRKWKFLPPDLNGETGRSYEVIMMQVGDICPDHSHGQSLGPQENLDLVRGI